LLRGELCIHDVPAVVIGSTVSQLYRSGTQTLARLGAYHSYGQIEVNPVMHEPGQANCHIHALAWMPQRRRITQDHVDQLWSDCLKETGLLPRFARSARPWEPVEQVHASITYASKAENLEALIRDETFFLLYEEQTRRKRMRIGLKTKSSFGAPELGAE
jgi:hypothetical protein